MIQPQAACDVGCHTLAEGVAELILHVCGLRMVSSLASFYAHRCLQVIVAPLQPTAQPIVVGQHEDALQVSHRATLVALQRFIVTEIGIIGGEISLLVQSVTHRPLCCVVIIVRVTVEVYVECHLVGFVQLPLASTSKTLVAILQVVELHVDGVFAARTVNAFPVGTSVGIKLQSFQGLVRQPLRYLPVGVTVHGLVARVLNEKLSLAWVLGGRVLPAVGVLQLEVRVTPQLADGDAQTVMLAQIAVAATTGAVLNEQPLVVLLGDDVHHASYGIRAVECRRGSLHYLNLLDVLWVYEAQVVLPAHVAVYAFAVNQHQDIGVAQSVQLHLRPHIVLAECERSRQPREDVLNRAARIVAEHFMRDNLRLYGRILQQVLRASTRYYHFLQTVSTPY